MGRVQEMEGQALGPTRNSGGQGEAEGGRGRRCFREESRIMIYDDDEIGVEDNLQRCDGWVVEMWRWMECGTYHWGIDGLGSGIGKGTSRYYILLHRPSTTQTFVSP